MSQFCSICMGEGGWAEYVRSEGRKMWFFCHPCRGTGEPIDTELRADYAAMKRGPGGHPRWGESARLCVKYGLTQGQIARIGTGRARKVGKE